MVFYLTEELVNRGHEVTLYASGDSETSARLRPACRRALRLSGDARGDPLARHLLLMETVAHESDRFDIIHFHLDYLPFSLSGCVS
jgi:hypothetical protein